MQAVTQKETYQFSLTYFHKRILISQTNLIKHDWTIKDIIEILASAIIAHTVNEFW